MPFHFIGRYDEYVLWVLDVVNGQPHRQLQGGLFTARIFQWQDNEQVNIAVGPGVAAGMRAKQNNAVWVKLARQAPRHTRDRASRRWVGPRGELGQAGMERRFRRHGILASLDDQPKVCHQSAIAA